MNKLTHQKEIDFTNLFRAIYQLVLHGDSIAARTYEGLTREASRIFYDSYDFRNDDTPHEDLGLDSILFMELKADKDEDAAKSYEGEIKRILNYTEHKYGLGQTQKMSLTVNQKEIDSIKLARALYQLVLHSESTSAHVYAHIALEAKRIFDDLDNSSGTLHPDLGLNLLEFTRLKAAGNDAAIDSGDTTRKMIESLEKKYGLTPT